jgi:hypothetical protein
VTNAPQQRFSEWSALQQSCLFSTFERDAIDSRLCGHAPASFNSEFFTPSWASNSDGDSVDLRSILDEKKKFNTFTNESMRQTYFDSALLLDLHRRGQWHLAEAAWRCCLVPHGHIMHDTVTSEFWMLLAVAMYPFSGNALSADIHDMNRFALAV